MEKISKPNYTLYGRITNQQGDPQKDLTIRAYDQDPRSNDDYLGEAVTDENGRYTIRFSEAQFKPVGKESGGPDVFIRVFDKNQKLLGESPVRRNAKNRIAIHLKLTADPQQPDKGMVFVVMGRVTQPNGNPIPRARVRVIDKKLLLKDDDVLGQIDTDQTGAYQVEYKSDRGTGADLLVQILDQNDEIVAASPLIIEAAKKQIIDIVMDDEAYPDLSEFEQLQDRLRPFLKGTDPADLDNGSVALLAGKSRVNPMNIAYLVQASQLAKKTGLEAEALYAMVRASQSGSLETLTSLDKSVLQQTLEEAAQANIVTGKVAEKTESVLTKLEAERVKDMLKKPALPSGYASLGDLLEIAELDNQHKRRFVEKFAAFNGTTGEFWNDLAKDNAFDAAASASIRLAIQLGSLTQNNKPLMASLHANLVKEGEGLRKLAGLSETEWLKEIRQHTDPNGNVILPPELPDVDGQTPEETYAQILKHQVEAAFPTASVAAALGRNDFNGAQTVKDFLDQHRDLELRDQNLRASLKDIAPQFTDENRDQLLAFKRVFDLAPIANRYTAMRLLLNDGLTSAYAIRKMGRRKFLGRYASVIGGENANLIYRAASQKSAMATALLASYSPMVNNLGVHAIPNGNLGTLLNQGNQDPTVDLADWEALFGSLSFCACEHCRSVYSPAAYLVDMLAFLREQDTAGGENALEALFKRRGDIGQIDLTCHNTNTTLPYVDLVIEVLEHYLANEAANTGNDWWEIGQVPQTIGDPKDLRIHPENIVAAAYETLQSRDYPWTLPYNHWSAEMRAYLEPLGAQRGEIMSLLNPHPANAQPEPLRNDVAAEILGLIPREWRIIRGQLARGLVGWGGEHLTELRKVKVLMNKGRLSYDEVRQLLDTKYINANQVLQITDDTCDIDDATIPALSERPHADRIHRFMRLQRKLGWDIYDLDAAIDVLGGGNLDDTFLRRLALVKNLSVTLRTPVLTLLSWWGNIDTTRRKDGEDEEQPSLYDWLFRNRTIGDEDDLLPFELNGSLSELADTNPTFDNVRAAILAALNLTTDADLDLIVEKRGLNEQLNLANLSELYRVASMAKALKLSVADLLELIDLTGFDPFDLDSLEDIGRQWIEVLAIIKATGTDAPELAYVLNHDFPADSSYASGELAIGDFLFRLRSSLSSLKDEYPLIVDPDIPGKMTVPPDPTGERTRLLLAQLVPEEILDQATSVIAGTPDEQLPGGAQNPFDRDAIADEYFAVFIDDLPAFKDQFIDEASASYLNPEAALAERYITVLLPLTTYLLETNSVGLVQQSFADFLDVDLRASDQLLGGLIKDVADPTRPAGIVFLDEAFVTSGQDPVTENDYPNQYQMVRRLQKIAFLLDQLDIPSDELQWLVEESTELDWLDLNSIPVTLQNPDPARFLAWLSMASFAWLRQQLPDNEPSLFVLLRMAHTGRDEDDNAIDKPQYVAHLHAATGWNQDDITTLLDANHYDLEFNADFTGQQALNHLLRLHPVIQLLQRLGISAKKAWTWAAADVTRELAAEVKQASRAKFEAAQWQSVAEPIRDDLRLIQRDALVDAALEIARTDKIEDIADLYAHFLMDVEMNPCMITSRIKQAISSAQLFIQRCLMNLEAGVVFDEEAALRWDWIKNYRVWEANRKIFLYPENWIEPELRSGKSPFFLDLENELLQSDVTPETVETAFLNYLEKLDEVAHLEIASFYDDKEDEGTLHVLGRTKSVPHKYFYRRWQNRRSWTPWEPVPVDIEGENVAITRHNRRLYLFWFMTQEKPDEKKNDQVKVPVADTNNAQTVDTEKPKKYLEIKLAWSQYWNGKWSPKILSEEGVRTVSQTGAINPRSFRPRPFPNRIKRGGLLVAVDYSYVLSSGQGGRWIVSRLADGQVLKGRKNFILTDDNRIGLTRRSAPPQRPFSYPYYYGQSNGSLAMRYGRKGYIRLMTGISNHPAIVVPLQYVAYSSRAPFFMEDRLRQYLVVPSNPVRAPDIADWVTASPGIAALNRIVHVPDAAAILPLGSLRADEGIIGSEPIFSAGMEGNVRPFSGVIGAAASVGTPLLAANGLDARNMVDTPEGSALINDGGNGITSSVGNLLTTLLGAPSQPQPGGLGVGAGSPFDLDIDMVDGADRVLGFSDFWVKVIQDRYQKYHFNIFYHPYVGLLIKQLNRYGIDGILDPLESGEAGDLRRQQTQEAETFADVYDLTANVAQNSMPVENFDFTYTGAYALYNWELFFHAPLLIAARLSANQQFEDAQKWFHYLFDPTAVFDASEDEPPYHYWKIKPFFENRGLDNIRNLLKLLSSNEPEDQAKREALEAQVAEWRLQPFQPHLIAQQRLVAYQKTTVMKYLDNLIAWGDYLFRRDSIESINEATQLYVLAAEILGKRPIALPAPSGALRLNGTEVKNFDDLDQNGVIDAFGNALVQIENELFTTPDLPDVPDGEGPSADILGSTLFFCVPKNDKLLRYWDTIADRLFKIRNCMNIEGVVRQLSLFEPPIDPGLLVRATAAGIDIGSVLNDLMAPRLQYRYSLLIQKAIEFCGDVKQLGSALLAALEKQDAEELALLRSSHEERLLTATRDVRRLQLEDSETSLAGLKKNLEVAQERLNFYRERERRLSEEDAQLDRLEDANNLELGVAGISLIKQVLALTPNYTLGGSGFGGSPHIVATGGSENLVHALDAISLNASALAQWANRSANMSSITGNLKRRDEEWDFQAAQAEIEIEALEKQIEGAQLRIAIAERELENHELQIEQNREVDEFMRLKFSNRELYSWMVSQIATVYFQSYRLAYDMAMRAQRAYQYELADYEASFINFGYWDSLKKGLLAGDQLHFDLRRMEMAHFEANRREYELTKHISLMQLNPAALIQLRETGSCEIDIPEVLFDLDYPGHILRRIKAVSLTIPCVTGPYTTVNCTLTLLNNRIRVRTDRPADAYSGLDDDRFISNVGGDQSIATSTAREDSGLFEFNFRDERYLPFEGGGAVGRWRLELPSDYRQFNYDTIADIVAHLRYTARDAGTDFKSTIENEIDDRVNQLVEALNQQGVFQFLSLKHENGTAFHKFLNPVGTAEHETTIPLSKHHFPFLFQGKGINIQNVFVFIKLRDGSLYSNSDPLVLTISRDGGPEREQSLVTAGDELGGLAHVIYDQLSGEITNPEEWILKVKESAVQDLPPALRQTVSIEGTAVERLIANEILDVGILFQYEVA